MIYSDLIFVFAFLPIYLVCQGLCREPWAKNLVGIAGSLVFILWGRQWYYALVLVPVFLLYAAGFVYKKSGLRLVWAVPEIAATAAAVFFSVDLAGEQTLSSALWTVGFIAFALRVAIYSSDICGGEEPERDLIALTYWLLAPETFLLPPLADGSGQRRKIRARRQTLSKMSSGLSLFIKGFAMTAVCGLAFERVRLAAVEYGKMPWANSAVYVAASALELYVCACGVVRMTGGLGLMSGISSESAVPAFIPKKTFGGHISEIWTGFSGAALGCFMGHAPAALAVISLMSGIFLGFGSGAGAFMGILMISAALESMGGKKTAFDTAFSVILAVAAFLSLSCGAPCGLMTLLRGFNISSYEYDITFALYDELLKAAPWLVIGLIAASPLPRILSGIIRRKMNDGGGAYAAIRTSETVLSVLLLILGTVAAAM